MSRDSARTGAAAAAVVAAVVGIVALGTVVGGTAAGAQAPESGVRGSLPAWLLPPSDAPALPVQLDVEQQGLVCPALSVDAVAAERVSALVLPEAAPGSGTLVIGEGAPAALGAPGTGTSTAASEAGTSGVVTAEGGYAGASAASRSFLADRGEGRGLTSTSCAPPAAEFWFPGVSGASGRVDELVLANPTTAPAVVTTVVLGPSGPIEVPGGGIVVQPGSTEVVRIDSLIPDVVPATLHVSVSGAVVSALVRSSDVDGLIPQGVEFLQPAAAPGTDVVVPGVPSGPGPRRLVLTSPAQDVAATVELLAADGTSALGERPVPVPAGFTVAIDLQTALEGRAAAVRIRADAPVTAAVLASVPAAPNPAVTGVLGRVPVADTADVVAAAPVTAVATLPLSGAGTNATVVASAVDAPVRLEVQVLPTGGPPGPVQTLEVAAGTTATAALAGGGGAPGAVVIRRVDGGTLFAAVNEVGALADGPVVSAAVALPLVRTVAVPVARPVPAALVR
jgi:hypothetical protein